MIKRKNLVKAKTISLIFATLFLLISIYFFVVKFNKFLTSIGLSPSMVISIIKSPSDNLKKSGNRTNILFLGVAGGIYAGSDLTDTMLIGSISNQGEATFLISIPRDLWSDTLKDKINSAYHYGEEKKKGGGTVLARSEAEDVTGIPIHYSFLIDFERFKEIIDTVGGIDVYITNSFSDPDYPIDGKEKDNCDGDPDYSCRYMEVVFAKGVEHMNGDRALIYVRSRHATGDEGTDFARSERQKAVFSALISKIFDFNNLININDNWQIYQKFKYALNTDMNFGELISIASIFLKNKSSIIRSINFENLLENPPAAYYDGRYVLVPKNGVEEIKDYLKQKLE